jgi:hypothetical protein
VILRFQFNKRGGFNFLLATGAKFNHSQRSWLVLWEAGVIIELPPWVVAIFPSSLFHHFNYDIAGERTGFCFYRHFYNLHQMLNLSPLKGMSAQLQKTQNPLRREMTQVEGVLYILTRLPCISHQRWALLRLALLNKEGTQAVLTMAKMFKKLLKKRLLFID